MATNSLPANARSGNTRAENTGEGTQALHQGDGNQNVAIGPNSTQYNYKAQTLYHINVSSISQIENLLQGRNAGFAEPSRILIVEWLMFLSKLDFVDYHRILLGQLVDGTGQWVLQSEAFQHWRDPLRPSRCLWMHGILGSGKTMLATMIINSLSNECGDDGRSAVTFLYFREEKDSQLTLNDVLVSLIKQLVQKQPTEVVAEQLAKSYKRWIQTKTPPDTVDYIAMFKAAASDFRTVYLIIDSLESLTDRKVAGGMIGVLRELPVNVRFLVTSRTGWLTGHELGQVQEVTVVPSKSDVQKYVERRIQDDEAMRRELSGDEGAIVEQEMVGKIISASKGMFLLTKLHMDYVSEQGSLGGIKSALKDLPKNKHTTFRASKDQLMARDRSARKYVRGLASHVLTWVIHAKRPLTTREVKESFAIKHSNKELNTNYISSEVDWTSLCAGFVVADPVSQTLRLVHESVGVYVIKKEIVPREYDLEMARACLKYLLLETTEQERDKKPGQSLLGYAASHWASHFQSGSQLAPDNADLEDVSTLALRFLRSGQKLEASFLALGCTERSAFHGMTGLHAATYFGLENMAKRLLEGDHANINAMCGNGQTALHWAVQYERTSMVKLFLDHEAVDPNIQDHRRDTPLHLAVVWSVCVNDTTVHNLVAKKARLDILGSKNQTPLSWAIRYGPHSTARILLDSMSPEAVAASTYDGWPVLRHIMVYCPKPDMIDDVLAKGADLNAPDPKDGWTPLRHAVQSGKNDMARRLLCRMPNPADVRLRDPEGNSALMWALFHGSQRMADLLIDYGATVNEKFPDGSTPLIKAAQSGYTALIWKLVRRGADLNHQDPDGRTALHHAIEGRDRSLAWLLVTRGASLTARDNKGLTVLDLAIEDNDIPLAWLLCEHGAVLDGAAAAGPGGLTMLHRAAGLGLVEAARFLLDRGADPDAKDDNGYTPLHHAVLEHKFSVARVLGNAGANVDARDAHGATPLHNAIARRSGRRRMLDVLFDLGAGLETVDSQGRTPLMLAAEMATDTSTVKIVQRLIDMGADVNRTNDRGLSAWSYAHGTEREEARMAILAAAPARKQKRLGRR